jgi:hypothetical protein
VAGVKGSEGETPGPMEVGARGSVDLDDYFTDKTDGSPQARSIVLAYCKTESGLGPLHKLCFPYLGMPLRERSSPPPPLPLPLPLHHWP